MRENHNNACVNQLVDSIQCAGAAAKSKLSEAAAKYGAGTTSNSIEGPAPESAAVKEHMEYFTACDTVITAPDPGCNTKYAEYDYGMPGANYVDYVMSQSVDSTVVSNHNEFIRDRVSGQAENQIITGRTYSPDAHTSYDPIPWVGLMRPQNVPVCNPDQVPDVDYSLYEDKRTLTW